MAVLLLFASPTAVAVVDGPELSALDFQDHRELDATVDHPRGPIQPPSGNLELQARRIENKEFDKQIYNKPEMRALMPWTKNAKVPPGPDLHSNFSDPKKAQLLMPAFDSLHRSKSTSDAHALGNAYTSAMLKSNPDFTLPPALHMNTSENAHLRSSTYGSLASERAQSWSTGEFEATRDGHVRRGPPPRVDDTLPWVMAAHHHAYKPQFHRPLESKGVHTGRDKKQRETALGRMGKPKVMGSEEGFYPMIVREGQPNLEGLKNMKEDRGMRQGVTHEMMNEMEKPARDRRMENTRLLLKDEKDRAAKQRENAQLRRAQGRASSSSARPRAGEASSSRTQPESSIVFTRGRASGEQRQAADRKPLMISTRGELLENAANKVRARQGNQEGGARPAEPPPELSRAQRRALQREQAKADKKAAKKGKGRL